MKLKALNPFPNLFSAQVHALGFAQMVMLDRDFQKKNYDFKFVRQNFSEKYAASFSTFNLRAT